MKEKGIYQVGDKVFDAQFGWGKIISIDISIYFIIVNYDSGNIASYNKQGKYGIDDLQPSLSFTEYDFVNGGFSQNRNDINKHFIGKLGFFWQNGHDLDGTSNISFGFLLKITNNKFVPKDNYTKVFDNFSIECPIKLS